MFGLVYGLISVPVGWHNTPAGLFVGFISSICLWVLFGVAGSVVVYCWLCEFLTTRFMGWWVRLLGLGLWALFWCLVAGLIGGFGWYGVYLLVGAGFPGCLGFCGLLQVAVAKFVGISGLLGWLWFW